MPTYRTLTLSLVSQFDILTIPEYAPPSIPPDPFTDVSTVPTLVNSSTSTVSVYIPTYPGSQFWLSYSIAPPWQQGVVYYFKLFVNGECLVNWGCGEEEGYKGKTMFGLFASAGGGRGIERRSLAFSPRTEDSAGGRGSMPGVLDDVMEVRVFRARGRKRITPEVTRYHRTDSMQKPTMPLSSSSKKTVSNFRAGDGIDMVNSGILNKNHPQRFYRYDLLDPLDQPFSTFRYYYRTWEQLETLGVISRPPSVESSSLCSSPVGKALSRKVSGDITQASKSVTGSLEGLKSVSSSPLEGDDVSYDLSTPKNGLTNEEEASAESVSPLDTIRSPLQYRPPTPPPSTSGPKKVTFMPTATGLVPTNLDPNPLALNAPSASSTGVTTNNSSAWLLTATKQNPTSSLANQTSRESFATLIHTHLNSPNPDSFRLIDLTPTIVNVSLKDQSLTAERRKWQRSLGRSTGSLRAVFGHDNLRDGSRESTRSSGGGKGRSSEAVDQNQSTTSKRATDGVNGSGVVEQVVQTQLDEVSVGVGVDHATETHTDSVSASKKENNKKEDNKARGRSRSRSREGASRKLHLWEVV